MLLDQYFTPPALATEVAEVAAVGDCVVDTACGEGRLLDAARRINGQVRCVGLDKDKNIIQRLRRRRNDWLLSAGDILNPGSVRSARAVSATTRCDSLLLNPPFSHGRSKAVAVEFFGHGIRSSVAMAHVLRSLELFQPQQGAVAIVPESLLYSETDAAGRTLLASHYRLAHIRDVRCTTFRGARARSSLVHFTREPSPVAPGGDPLETLRSIRIVRGGLPLFEAEWASSGVPFIHSTDIRAVVRQGSTSECRRVVPIARGVVSGPVVLLPRVGVPKRDSLEAIYLRSRTQLSDCVIGLRCRSIAQARLVANRLRRQHAELCDVYRGTGARYVTLQRLERRLAGVLAGVADA